MRYGHHDSLSWVSFDGAIRYTEARELKAVLDQVVLPELGDTVVLDLRDVDSIDSTGLGLLASIGRHALSQSRRRAVIVCPEGAVAQTLRAMRFDKLFTLTEQLETPDELSLEVVNTAQPHENLARVMLEAHRQLCDVDERNKKRFNDVLEQLEHANRKRGDSQH